MIVEEVKDVISGAETLSETNSNVGAAIEAVTALHGKTQFNIELDDADGLRLLTVPSGMRLVNVTSDLDARRPGPRRVKAVEKATTLKSFVDLVMRHKDVGTSIWADVSGPKMTAIIDYHLSSDGQTLPAARWGDHKVTYAFPFTPTFIRWRDMRLTSQKDFLLFVQKRACDIVDPEDIGEPEKGKLVRDVMLDVLRAAGHTRAVREEVAPAAFYGNASGLIEAAKRMSSKVSCSVKEVDHGLGGVSITFEDEKHVLGIEKAREFYLVEVEVFEGSEKVVMPVRLRALATDGGLLIGLELVGLDLVIDQAFKAAVERVKDDTKVPIFHGGVSG